MSNRAVQLFNVNFTILFFFFFLRIYGNKSHTNISFEMSEVKSQVKSRYISNWHYRINKKFNLFISA